MTLYEYLQGYQDEELTVWDEDYDMETYFYKETSDDEWDKAMADLSKLLTVTSETPDGVCVNLSQLIETNMDRLYPDVFNTKNMDTIMFGMADILAGNVSEKWFIRFVNALKPDTPESVLRAVRKYDDKMERINCRFDPGTKKRVKDLGYSLNSFIRFAVYEKLEHDERILGKHKEGQP